ncbi:MAG: omptin family outer membrane protease [Syntrophobacteraceae bacterium]|nr:omptin family outer membrane protease [Desulfobacteraceae bacterium]
MTVRMRGSVALGGLCLISFLVFLNASPAFSSPEEEPTFRLSEHLTLGIKTQRLIGSHTSYEFGNPEAPYQAPLSRLEFPLDSWWAGGELRVIFPRFSLGAEVLTNVPGDTDGRMKDSDWTDDDRPRVKTIYSEMLCRLQTSYAVGTDIDLKVSDWLCLPEWVDLRPVAGFRYQSLNLLVHDGAQYDLTGLSPPYHIVGNAIDFDQTYYQYFLGMRAGFDLGKYAGRLKLKKLAVRLQVDWAYVDGHNRDHHLLREGVRYTFEDTHGDAWHGLIGLEAGFTEHLSLALEGDFLAISTTGSHRFVNESFGVDEKWSNGVRVWSDQNSLSLKLRYAF